MVGHVSVPALDPDPNRVATTSPAITTDLLKKQLGFHGLVVTDGLDIEWAYPALRCQPRTRLGRRLQSRERSFAYPC